MSYFVSREKSPKVTLKTAGYRLIELPDGSTHKEPIHGVHVRFQYLGDEKGVPVDGLPARKASNMILRDDHGNVIDTEGNPTAVALGILTIEDGARQAGMDPSAFIDAMRDHPAYGIQFVYVDDRGRKVDEDRFPKVEKDGLPQGTQSNPDGTYTCLLCDQTFDKRGSLNLHCAKKKEHGDLLARYRAILKSETLAV